MLSLSPATATLLLASLATPKGRPILAAVSGGGDSLFLLLLLHLLLSERDRADDLVAVTVDHGLRPESAAEAAWVAALCRERGIAHRTLRWVGKKPRSGLAAAARVARLHLLLKAARDLGAGLIAVGHTLDDQAETIFMRKARGEGRGLAGIAPATLLDGAVWIARPLLGERRADIRAALRAAGRDWIDDPSNDRLDSERVRARAALADRDGEAAAGELLAMGRDAARRRTRLSRLAADVLRAHAAMVSPGLFRLDAGFAGGTDPDAVLLSLRILLANAGGSEHLPEEARTRALLARVVDGPFRATLGGAVVDRRKDAIFFHRERRSGWTGRMEPTPRALWDGRFRMGPGPFGSGVVVEALGMARAREAAAEHPALPPALVRAALAAEPILLHPVDDGVVAEAPKRVPAPWARLLPSFDLAAARAVADLFGGDVVPLPWTGHNDA